MDTRDTHTDRHDCQKPCTTPLVLHSSHSHALTYTWTHTHAHTLTYAGTYVHTHTLHPFPTVFKLSELGRDELYIHRMDDTFYLERLADMEQQLGPWIT